MCVFLIIGSTENALGYFPGEYSNGLGLATPIAPTSFVLATAGLSGSTTG